MNTRRGRLAVGNNADRDYRYRMKNVQKLMKEVGDQLESHGRKQRLMLENYAYVGDLEHVGDLLGQISDFLKSSTEFKNRTMEEAG